MPPRIRLEDVRRLSPFVPLVAATALLALVSTRAILARTGGEPAVPLDDSYIHFQFARSFAELRPFVFSPGSEPTPGTTSLLWPLVLAPFWALGLKGTALIWAAWAMGWASLGLLARETYLLATGLVTRECAIAAGAMVLAFGGLVWCAGSGMEVVPFSFLLVWSARLSAQWRDRASAPASRRELALALTVATLTASGRPEGIIGSTCVAIAIARWPRDRSRLWALLALAAPLLPLGVNRIFTGQATSTTTLAKWLPANPYYDGGRLLQAMADNVVLLFGTLFDGQIWSAIFLPAGSRLVAWLALPALGWLAFRRAGFRGLAALAVALGILVPSSFDCMLCNRLRYLWPFMPGWFVALAALADVAGSLAEAWQKPLGAVRVLLAGVFVGGLASQLSPSIDDLAASSEAIRAQQAAFGRWAKRELPADARIGVNDTGAIAYFSERRVFDIVGLTTRSEPRYWAAGAGSRFEHYERMPRAELPTHFIVYPQWMAIPSLLGPVLGEITVHATILGGTTMIAHQADYRVLGSAEAPLGAAPGQLVDRLDVADLESEAEHDYELLPASQPWNQVFTSGAPAKPRADGGRRERILERFRLEVAPGGRLVARVVAENATSLAVRVDGREVGRWSVSASPEWQELELALPGDVGVGRREIRLEPSPAAFAGLHYWSYAGP